MTEHLRQQMLDWRTIFWIYIVGLWEKEPEITNKPQIDWFQCCFSVWQCFTAGTWIIVRTTEHVWFWNRSKSRVTMGPTQYERRKSSLGVSARSMFWEKDVTQVRTSDVRCYSSIFFQWLYCVNTCIMWFAVTTCISHPCQNHATCVRFEDGYRCQCYEGRKGTIPGQTGAQCEQRESSLIFSLQDSHGSVLLLNEEINDCKRNTTSEIVVENLSLHSDVNFTGTSHKILALL